MRLYRGISQGACKLVGTLMEIKQISMIYLFFYGKYIIIPYEAYTSNMQVNVSIESGEGFCIKIVLRCLAAPGDGLGHREVDDGGLLGGIVAAGFKGEKYYCT